jgi:hypothetical protein
MVMAKNSTNRTYALTRTGMNVDEVVSCDISGSYKIPVSNDRFLLQDYGDHILVSGKQIVSVIDITKLIEGNVIPRDRLVDIDGIPN